MASNQKENRRLWIIFIICLLIALLPWIVLANGRKANDSPLLKCQKESRCDGTIDQNSQPDPS